MSSTTTPIVSPPLVATGVFPDRDRLPSQSSTSQLAPAPQTTSVSQLASARYVRQFRAFLDHQRELFSEERALWQIERSELHDHIARLEDSLQQARTMSSSQTSPTGTSLSGRRFSTISAASRSGLVGGTGDEFWRGAGGKIDAHPARVFSSVSTEGCVIPVVTHLCCYHELIRQWKRYTNDPVSSQHLPSISENVPPRELAATSSSPGRRTSIPGPRIPEVGNSSGTFDGINFRQNSRASSVAPSGSHVSPGTIPLPSRLGPPDEYITEHAGHTPLARGFRNDTDGTPGAVTSSTPTPTEPQRERPPHEPHASLARPPSGRYRAYEIEHFLKADVLTLILRAF